MLTNYSGWFQKQGTGLEGTVTDKLFQVFHIERQELLLGLSEYLLKIEYSILTLVSYKNDKGQQKLV